MFTYSLKLLHRLFVAELQPQVRGWLLGSVDGRRGLVPYNYIKVLGKRRGQQPQGPVPTTPAVTSITPSTFPSQSLSSAFPQASSSVGGLAQSTDSGFGQQSTGFPVPDMDSIFGSAQQAGVLPTSAGDGQHASVNQQSENLNAADILEKQMGE